ncbi:MAG: hypothetical protein OXF05_02695 [Hyphomicrobiales bacterium]|nr:hypothetical protein [Hyphomicrobiales bacterium]
MKPPIPKQPIKHVDWSRTLQKYQQGLNGQRLDKRYGPSDTEPFPQPNISKFSKSNGELPKTHLHKAVEALLKRTQPKNQKKGRILLFTVTGLYFWLKTDITTRAIEIRTEIREVMNHDKLYCYLR